MTFLNSDRSMRPVAGRPIGGRFGVLAARLAGFFEAVRQDRTRRRPIRPERSVVAWGGSPYREVLNQAGVGE